MIHQRKVTQKLINESEGGDSNGIKLDSLHLAKCSILEKESEFEIYEDLRAEHNFDDTILDMMTGLRNED